MGKKVDLEAIKAVAVSMLYVDPVPVPKLFDMVVHHPYFTHPWIQSVSEHFDVFDYRTEPEKFMQWREDMKKMILGFDNVNRILLTLNSAYLMNFLRLTYTYFHNNKELADALRFCWTYQEFPNWTERGRPLLTIRKMFRLTRNYIMTPDEQRVYDELPNKVTVYRGQSHQGRYYNALSWTLDGEKAMWFANRFHSETNQGTTYKAVIDKKYIYAYLDERGESEVILDFTKLENIERL